MGCNSSCCTRKAPKVHPLPPQSDEEEEPPSLSLNNSMIDIPILSDSEEHPISDTSVEEPSTTGTLSSLSSFGEYTLIRQIGKGQSAEVYLTEKNGIQYAVKVCKEQAKTTYLNTETHKPRDEAAILRNFNHPNVIKVFDILDNVESGTISIVQEYLPNGTIDQITDVDQLHEAYAQVLAALEYVHFQGIAHRDIKPENILLDSKNIPRICDFGISEFVPEADTVKMYEMKGSPAYQAPELFDNKPYNLFKADIWSLGITLYHSEFHSLPFISDNLFNLQKIILNNEPSFPSNADPIFVDFLKKMLVKDPNQRADILTLWDHEFMSVYKKQYRKPLIKYSKIFKTLTKMDRKNSVRVTREVIVSSREQIPSARTHSNLAHSSSTDSI